MEREERPHEQMGAPAPIHAQSGNSPKAKKVTTSGSAGGGAGSVIAWPDRPADEEQRSAKGHKKKEKKKEKKNKGQKGAEDNRPEENDDHESDSSGSEDGDTSSTSNVASSSSLSSSTASSSSSSSNRPNRDNGADLYASSSPPARRNSDRSQNLSSGSSTGSEAGGGGTGTRGGSAGGIGGEESSGSWAILGQLGSKPRKETYGDDKESRRQYRQAKKNWDERKRNLIDSLTPDEVREYKKEKKELTEKERLERKRERQERRRLVKEKKKLYKKPKIGKLVTQETKSYELVCDMLLGIRVTVSKVSARPLHGHTVKDSDFRRVHNVRFPSAGSTNGVIPTPAHSQRDFSFRDYAPVVFRRIREHFGIEADDYLISLTGDYILSELISPGQSGQFFYFSYDLRFMLKTVTRGEAKFLKAILPRYYNHIMQNPSTLIVRFFGFHRVAPHRDRKHYFVVMGNVFAQNLELHYRFDLKGSSVGRVTAPEKIKNDPNVVMKDQDFDRLRKTIALGPEKRKLFIDQINKDVDLLEQLGIMDYSLLVGIHDRRRLQKGRSLSMVYLPKAVDDEQLATAKGFNADTDTDSSDSESDEEKLEQHHVTVFTQDQGGIQSTDEENQGTDYIYFLGIIDILQPFNLRKRAEHGLKSFRYDGDQISAVNPRLYARRFKEFTFARVRQPDTPQTPREIIGLPPRLPEGSADEVDDGDAEEKDGKHRQDEGAEEEEQHRQLPRDGEKGIERNAKPSGEQAGSAKKPNNKSKKASKGEASSVSKSNQPAALVASAGREPSLNSSAGSDGATRSGAPSSLSPAQKSTQEAVGGGGAHESSPRVGNAGLVPKQLKVEKKKKKQKKQTRKHPHAEADPATVTTSAT